MKDTINRQDAIDAIEQMWNWETVDGIQTSTALRQVIADIKNVPSAEPEIAKRIVGKSRDGMTLWYQCDMCNEPVDVQDNFCRGCGRRLIDE